MGLAYLLLSIIPCCTCCIVGALRSWFRVQLKQQMGINPHYATDILLSTCCCWFARGRKHRRLTRRLESTSSAASSSSANAETMSQDWTRHRNHITWEIRQEMRIWRWCDMLLLEAPKRDLPHSYPTLTQGASS